MREPEPDTHHAAHRNPVGFELAGRVQTLDADALHLSRQRAFTEGRRPNDTEASPNLSQHRHHVSHELVADGAEGDIERLPDRTAPPWRSHRREQYRQRAHRSRRPALPTDWEVLVVRQPAHRHVAALKHALRPREGVPLRSASSRTCESTPNFEQVAQTLTRSREPSGRRRAEVYRLRVSLERLFYL